MEPANRTPPSSAATPSSSGSSSERGSRIGRTLQKIADKVAETVSSHSKFKVGDFISKKNVKAKVLTYDDLKVGGVYVLQYPESLEGLIRYQIVRVVEKPPPFLSDRSVDLIVVANDNEEPQYVFAKWMRKLKE